jgi:hypothetical protein
MTTTNEAYPWPYVTQIFRNDWPRHSGGRTSLLLGMIGSVTSVAFVLVSILYQGTMNRKQNSRISYYVLHVF